MTSRVGARLRAFMGSLDEHDAFGAASALAFDGFFSLVPLLAIAGWVLHRLLDTSSTVLEPLLRLTPAAFASVADLELMRAVKAGSPLTAPLSLVGFAWLASSGGARAILQLERMYGAPKRSWWRRRAVALAFAVGGLVITAVAVSIGLWLVLRIPGSGETVALTLSFLALWLLVGAFYRAAVRRPDGARKHGFRGALVTLVSWTGLSMIFSTYVSKFADYTKFYGSLAAVAVVLVWMWLMALALLVGAEVNAWIEGLRGGTRFVAR